MSLPEEQPFPSCHDTCGTFSPGTDDPVLVCHDCQTGCTSRRTDESTEEEISAGPYLVLAAIIMILISVAIKWLF